MTTRNQELTYEALASALYNLPFTRFHGEFPAEDGRDMWKGTLSNNPARVRSVRDDPEQLKVSIELFEETHVVVNLAWRNISNPEPVTGTQHIRIPTEVEEAVLHATVEACVVRVLEVFRDILGGVGVAGPLEETAPESEAGDEDDPNDSARTDEEVGRE